MAYNLSIYIYPYLIGNANVLKCKQKGFLLCWYHSSFGFGSLSKTKGFIKSVTYFLPIPIYWPFYSVLFTKKVWKGVEIFKIWTKILSLRNIVKKIYWCQFFNKIGGPKLETNLWVSLPPFSSLKKVWKWLKRCEN